MKLFAFRDRIRLNALAVLGRSLFALTCLLASSLRSAEDEDIVIDAFDGASFEGWHVTGKAFGNGPVRGTLPNQMNVDGYLGMGYVNSYHDGDGSIGTMQSKEFLIERPYINFLIGGGAFPGQTCIRLRVDGQVVAESVGPNRNSGGSERLQWNGWDVRQWQGQKGSIEIIDDHVGGWGHISIDQLVQSDTSRGPKDYSREIQISQDYLLLPVDASAPLVSLQALDGPTRTHQLDISLGSSKADFLAPLDVRQWRGKTLKWTFRSNDGEAAKQRLDAIQSSNAPITDRDGANSVRPTYHFTAQTGWLNDPNGLVYYDNLWHLYFQHNPVGWNWGNMHWGHATSKDLLHWTEEGDVFRPWVQLRGAAFSGSAIVDTNNSSGWGVNGKAPLIAALTDTDAGESIAYSQDGFQWKLFDGNPVVKHPGRDPRLLWHADSQRWIMAVYDETDGKQNISFHSSSDFKAWKFESKIDGFFECPDLFELPHPNRPGQSSWVLYAADGQYLLGTFDGHAFTPDSQTKERLWWGNFYAAQTFSNSPDGRRIQVGWGQGIEFPGQRFNQQMTLPVELSLRDSKTGVRMVARPVRELDTAGRAVRNLPTSMPIPNTGTTPIQLASSSTDVSWDFVFATQSIATIELRGVKITVDSAAKKISIGDVVVPIRGSSERVALRLLIDRGSLELFIGDGDAVISRALRPNADPDELSFFSQGTVRIENLRAQDLDSASQLP